MEKRPSVTIVTPALADANNGNSTTALRWASLLEDEFEVVLCKEWHPTDKLTDLMLALHARRSALSIANWATYWQCQKDCPSLIVALTGTDLYKDLPHSVEAQNSIRLAGFLITLQEMALVRLPENLRSKCWTIFQSMPKPSPLLDRVKKSLRTVIAVGHLRWEKCPETFIEAARKLQHRGDLEFIHLGNALDEEHRQMAEDANRQIKGYHWLGGRPAAETLQAIQNAELLVHPSRMEGGAHVVMEAMRCKLPVLASRIDGNVGLLGADYEGYFDLGNSAQLASLIDQALPVACQSQNGPGFLDTLRRQIDLRDCLFEPALEQSKLKALLHKALQSHAQSNQSGV